MVFKFSAFDTNAAFAPGVFGVLQTTFYTKTAIIAAFYLTEKVVTRWTSVLLIFKTTVLYAVNKTYASTAFGSFLTALFAISARIAPRKAVAFLAFAASVAQPPLTRGAIVAVSAFFSAATPIVDVFVTKFAVVAEVDTAFQTNPFIAFASGRVAEAVVTVPTMQPCRHPARNAYATFAAEIFTVIEETFSALVADPFFVAKDTVRFAMVHINVAVVVQRIHTYAASGTRR